MGRPVCDSEPEPVALESVRARPLMLVRGVGAFVDSVPELVAAVSAAAAAFAFFSLKAFSAPRISELYGGSNWKRLRTVNTLVVKNDRPSCFASVDKGCD